MGIVDAAGRFNVSMLPQYYRRAVPQEYAADTGTLQVREYYCGHCDRLTLTHCRQYMFWNMGLIGLASVEWTYCTICKQLAHIVHEDAWSTRFIHIRGRSDTRIQAVSWMRSLIRSFAARYASRYGR